MHPRIRNIFVVFLLYDYKRFSYFFKRDFLLKNQSYLNDEAGASVQQNDDNSHLRKVTAGTLSVHTAMLKIMQRAIWLKMVVGSVNAFVRDRNRT